MNDASARAERAGDDERPARKRRRWPWLLGVLVAIGLIVGVGIPYVYIHFINKPAPRLSFEQRDKELAKKAATSVASATTSDSTAAAASGSASASDVSGTWSVTTPSTAGYRIKEVIAGQKAEAVGRTDKVDGTVTIDGSTVTTAELSVDLTAVKSDQAKRDAQFNGRIMNTNEFPVAIFTLEKAIDLGSVPGEGTAIDASATGTLSLHGVDKQVTIPIKARLVSGGIEVQGSLDLVFADYGIENPSIGPVSTEDHGLLEFLVTLKRS